ncbi:MAG: DUF445 family protein, partial [Selenomonadaceae bacterium]|nr:DUF445 family protein [Selenomonadaceae bacterium]
KDGLETMFRSLGKNEAVHEVFCRWKDQYLGKVDFSGWMAGWLDANVKRDHPFWLEPLDRFVEGKLLEFSQREDWQQRFDSMIKDFIEAELIKHHDLIPKLIRERLDEFSDENLTEFVESRVSDDLQMIRINGSLVGSLVGMGLYVVAWAAERVWGM